MTIDAVKIVARTCVLWCRHSLQHQYIVLINLIEIIYEIGCEKLLDFS
jgi:hypothetical protein